MFVLAGWVRGVAANLRPQCEATRLRCTDAQAPGTGVGGRVPPWHGVANTAASLAVSRKRRETHVTAPRKIIFRLASVPLRNLSTERPELPLQPSSGLPSDFPCLRASYVAGQMPPGSARLGSGWLLAVHHAALADPAARPGTVGRHSWLAPPVPWLRVCHACLMHGVRRNPDSGIHAAPEPYKYSGWPPLQPHHNHTRYTTMQFAYLLSTATLAAVASAYSYVTVTQDGATYVETITEESDLSTPAGAYITYKVITGTKGTATYTKTIWSTVYTASSTEAAEASSTAAAASAAETTTADVASSTAAETTAAASSAAESTTAAAAESSAASSAASVSTYSGAVARVQAAAGLVGAAGVAALLI